MAILSAFIRRILGPSSFPLVVEPLDRIEPQVYQPPVVPRPGELPVPTPAPQEP